MIRDLLLVAAGIAAGGVLVYVLLLAGLAKALSEHW